MVEQFSTVVVMFDPEEGITDVRIMQTGACTHLGGWGARDSGPQEWRLWVGIKVQIQGRLVFLAAPEYTVTRKL